jgi:hypothetical protein
MEGAMSEPVIEYRYVEKKIWQVWKDRAYRGLVKRKKFVPCKFAPPLTEEEIKEVQAWAVGVK